MCDFILMACLLRTILVSFKISKSQYEKVWNYIEAGKREGANLVIGGEKRSGKGFFVDPTSFVIL